MDRFISNLQRRYHEGDILVRLIFINVGLFIMIRLADVALMLFNHSLAPLLRFIEFPSAPMAFLMQPWSLITYMFTHYDIWHILFNMLWLYWFGRMFLNYFDARKLFAVYLLGGIFGALLFMGAYNLFPYYANAAMESYLLGASASVMAIVFGVAFYARDAEVSLLIVGRIKILYLALFTLLLDFLSITSVNAGGHLAHLGGALFGICFAHYARSGKDITRILNRTIDKIANLFARKPKMKVTYKRNETDYEYRARKRQEEVQIDAILDKLKRSGYQSLSAEEKKQLFDASKK